MLKSILHKEFLLLIRDRMGLTFLLLMPVALVLIMTSLQDSTFKALEKEHIDIVILNQDSKILGDAMIQALDSAGVFNMTVVENVNDNVLSETKNQVREGHFEIGVLIPQGATKQIRKRISQEIKKQLPQLGKKGTFEDTPTEIEIFFAPMIKGVFKQAVSESVREIIAHIQTQMIFKSYTKTIERITGKANNDNFPIRNIHLVETSVGQMKSEDLPNSSEHNVPAWTVFAIFFIVIPLSGQMINEKKLGTLKRIKTFPTNMVYHYSGKVVIYTLTSILQVLILILIGHFVLPLIGLPEFPIDSLFRVLVFTIFIGLASSSFAIAVGTIARTQHQASIFGSISVVILAAIGGIWVPTYVMSDAMQVIAQLSPLNWSLEGYHKIILQHSDWALVLPNILKLLAFSVLAISLAVVYSKRKG